MALEFVAKQLISYDPQQSSEKITDSYISLVRGLMSFPLNFPGTAYYKCMKDRKKAMNMVREVLKQRLASPPEKRQGDFLDHVIQDMNSQDFLIEDFVVQLFFGLLYVSFDTISTMTTLTFKLLDENPDVLQELI
ncbi:cucurbitadienol 11-hydroxylase-like, partial [Fagus crenata]